MAYKGKTLDQMTSSERAKRVAELVRTKNTSAIKNPQYLPANLRKERELNTRLKQPIVPGSTVTNRDLAHQRSAAVTTEFGADAVPKAEQQGRDVSGWYDQYLAQLNAYQQGVKASQDKATQNLAGLATINQGPVEQAPQGPGSNASVAGLGQQAQLSRSNQFANLQGVSEVQGKNANDYAAALAHVIGPGQKLSAQAGEQQKVKDLVSKIGAFKTSFDAETKSGESKNVQAAESNRIARKAFNLKETTAKSADADKTIKRRLASKKWAQTTDTTYGISNGAVSSLRKQGPSGRAKLESMKAKRDKLLHPPKDKSSSTYKDPFGNTRDARIGRTSDFRKIVEDAKQTAALHKKKTGKTLSWREVLNIIGPDYKTTNVDVLNGAVQVGALGKVGPNTAKALEALGLDPARYK